MKWEQSIAGEQVPTMLNLQSENNDTEKYDSCLETSTNLLSGASRGRGIPTIESEQS